jgi:hypothetical protein
MAPAHNSGVNVVRRLAVALDGEEAKGFWRLAPTKANLAEIRRSWMRAAGSGLLSRRWNVYLRPAQGEEAC